MLHIGVSSVLSLYLLPELLAAYHEKTPEIRFRTSCSDSLDVINKVADNTCASVWSAQRPRRPTANFCRSPRRAGDCNNLNTPHFSYQGQPDPLTALLREPFLLREDNSGTKTGNTVVSSRITVCRLMN